MEHGTHMWIENRKHRMTIIIVVTTITTTTATKHNYYWIDVEDKMIWRGYSHYTFPIIFHCQRPINILSRHSFKIHCMSHIRLAKRRHRTWRCPSEDKTSGLWVCIKLKDFLLSEKKHHVDYVSEILISKKVELVSRAEGVNGILFN